MTGLRVGLDIGAVKESFAVLNARKGVADVRLAGADGFDLAPFQLKAGFITVENMEIAQRLAIDDRLGCHDNFTQALRL